MGGLSKPRLSALWHGVLGIPKVGHYRSTAENVDEDILRLGRGPLAVELDLMEPIDPSRAPKVHQPALNHIGLWVDPLLAAVEHLQVRVSYGAGRWGGRLSITCLSHPLSSGDEGPVARVLGAAMIMAGQVI